MKLKVKIQTPVGDTKESNTGPIVTQGGIDGAVISSVSIGNDVGESFTDNNEVEAMKYESVDLYPMCYMDDIFNMCENVAATQASNNLMEEVVGKKGLEFNYEKSMFLVMGNKKTRAKLQEEIRKTPIKLSNQNMKEVTVMKYLGEQISFNLEESVKQTVTKRA